MKLYGIALIFVLSLLTGCASNNSQTPSFESYQTKSQPTGGSDAALAAHTMY